MRTVAIVLGAVTAAFLVYGIAVDSPSVWYYVPVTVVLAGAVWLIHRSAGFSNAALWALAAAAVGNLAGGVLLVNGEPLYQLQVLGEVRYDKFFHASASGVAAWASLEALDRWTGRRRPALAFAALMIAGGAGAFVEIAEYVGTLVRQNTVVGGYDNNMQDLIANTVGAAVGVTWAYRGSGRTGRVPTQPV